MIKDEESSIDDNVQKNLLLCFSSGSQLLCPLMMKTEESKEFSSETNMIKWLMTDLHQNVVKKSFEAIETLTSIAKNFPLVFVEYWDQFKDYINIVFSITETKRTVATLKLLESWISSISHEQYKLNQILEPTENTYGEELKSNTSEQEALENLKQYDILQLDG